VRRKYSSEKEDVKSCFLFVEYNELMSSSKKVIDIIPLRKIAGSYKKWEYKNSYMDYLENSTCVL